VRVLDDNHYLIQVKDKRWIAFSQVSLQPGQAVIARVKGNFPQLIFQLLNPLTGDTEGELTATDNLFNQQINRQISQWLTDTPFQHPFFQKSLGQLLSGQFELDRFLNLLQELVPEDKQTLISQLEGDGGETPLLFPHRWVTALMPEDKGQKNLVGFRQLLEWSQGLMKNSGEGSETKELAALWHQSWQTIWGIQLFNRLDISPFMLYPWLYREAEQWRQGWMAQRKNREADTVYLIFQTPLNQTWLETHFFYRPDAALLLKFRSPDEELLQRLSLSSDELIEKLAGLSIPLQKITTEVGDVIPLPQQFWPAMSQGGQIDFQV